MAIARELSVQYVEGPFAYSLQKPVGRRRLFHACISDYVKPSARSVSSMVHDALRSAEEKGMPSDGSWTENLKQTAATAFLGRFPVFVYLVRPFTDFHPQIY